MIKFTCQCGQNIKVSDKHAGKNGKCPKCKTHITVPSIKPALIIDETSSDVTQQSSPALNDPIKTKEPTKQCSFCGEEILAVAQKCKHCGEFFEQNKKHSSNAAVVLEQEGVLRFRGSYENAFERMEAVMVQAGGSIQKKDIHSGRIEGTWKYQVKDGLRVMADFRDIGNGDTRVTVRGGIKAGLDTLGKAKKKANMIAENFTIISNESNSTINQSNVRPPAIYNSNEVPYRGKKKFLACLYALGLGGFGIHKFYLGGWGWGIIYVLFLWTFIPPVIAFVEFIVLVASSPEKFDAKYNYTEPSPFMW